jgi:hypothetical protein
MGYLPKNDKGNVCMDPYTGLTGDQISSLVTQTNITSGSVFVGQTTGPSPTGGGTQTTAGAFANFQQLTGTSFGATGGFVTVGSCFISQTAGGGGTATVTGLDAGTITMNGPGGTSTLQRFPQVAGTYIGQLSSIPPAATFTFHGSGGSGPNSIGPFDTSVNFPAQLLTWTNQTAGSTVNRNSGVTFNWSGGSPGTFVVITGSSSDGKVSGSFTCIAPVEAQSFNVKSFITQAMPAGSGTLSIQNSTSFKTFSANGLGQGISGGFTSTMINATYQ